MVVTALNQFGSIVSFAIDLEDKLHQFYSQMVKNGGEFQDEFNSRLKSCKKHKINLERTRRENITEITLEPVEGLSIEDYQLNLTDDTKANINAIEEIVEQFYQDTFPKINVLETQRIFKRCLKEHNNRKKLK